MSRGSGVEVKHCEKKDSRSLAHTVLLGLSGTAAIRVRRSLWKLSMVTIRGQQGTVWKGSSYGPSSPSRVPQRAEAPQHE